MCLERNTGTFGTQHVVSTGVEKASVLAADIDGDGDMDLVSAYSADNKHGHEVSWYENTDGKGTFGMQEVISTSAGNYFYSGDCLPSLIAADIDGDGDMDLASGSENYHPAWYENTDGKGTFRKHQLALNNALGIENMP